MKRLERLYALTEEIGRHAPAPLSAAWLAERFQVSRRTVERDLAALRAAGVPLRAAQGRGGGTVVDPGSTWTPVALNPAEVTALLLALAAAPGNPYGYAARTATAKLVDALPAASRADVERLRTRFRVVAPAPPPPDPMVAGVVEEGVRTRAVLRIAFTDRHGTRTTRDVEPVGYYGSHEGWSLVAWCRLRQDGRLFRLDRIGSAQLTREIARERDLDDTLGWVPGPLTIPG